MLKVIQIAKPLAVLKGEELIQPSNVIYRVSIGTSTSLPSAIPILARYSKDSPHWASNSSVTLSAFFMIIAIRDADKAETIFFKNQIINYIFIFRIQVCGLNMRSEDRQGGCYV